MVRWPRSALLFGGVVPSAWSCSSDKPTEPSTDARRSSAALAATYTVRDLGTLGGPSSRASDLNNAGVVVGHSPTRTGATHAFRWQYGLTTDLGTLSGGTNSSATVIDKSVVIVVGSIDHNPPDCQATEAFVWKDGGAGATP
jgi:probable HAF family extracellular repeat protein